MYFNEFSHVHCHFQELPLKYDLFDLINHRLKAQVGSIKVLLHKDRFVSFTWKEEYLCLIYVKHHSQDQRNAHNHKGNSWYHQLSGFYTVFHLHIPHHLLDRFLIPNDANQCYWYAFVFDSQLIPLHFLRLLLVILPLLQRHSFYQQFAKEVGLFLIDNQTLHQTYQFECSFNHHQWNAFYQLVKVKLFQLLLLVANSFDLVKAHLILNFDSRNFFLISFKACH